MVEYSVVSHVQGIYTVVSSPLRNIRILLTSNGNDVETKRNDTSIIGVFSVSKRNEPSYSRFCQIEEKTNIISSRPCSIEAKRPELIKIYVGSNKNVLGQSKTLQDRSKANVISPYTNKIDEETKLSLQKDRSESKPCQSQFLQDRRKIEFVLNLTGSKRKQCGLVQLQIRSKHSEPSLSKTSRDRSKNEQNRPTFKGTVSRDFLLLVFFMNQFAPSHRVFLEDSFEFFRKFAEIFGAQGLPPVSATPVANGKNLQSEKF